MSQNVWATIMPFGPVTNILLAQNFFFGPAFGWPSFQMLPGKDLSPVDNGCPIFLIVEVLIN
jgi:hypothetical protein